MKIYGLIGFPLSHSFSTKYFAEKFRKENIRNCRYENFPLHAIDDFPALIAEHEMAGLNVTIPYKEKVLSFLDDRTAVVAETGACNCIKFENGKLIGYNTDVVGFEKALLSDWEPRLQQALVLGSGGAAKAVVYVLKKLRIPFRIVSRKEKGAGYLGYGELVPDLIREHELIINTTPIGMFPDITGTPLSDFQAIGGNHFLFDLIYNPEQTLFLQKGAERGAKVQNGMEMLRIQAEESWNIWNNLI
ncbi:MAG: shikimate dehydrogenase [Terrimonas sp.]|nr:shikimate dehydrogenase [Terrimonas sp.]